MIFLSSVALRAIVSSLALMVYAAEGSEGIANRSVGWLNRRMLMVYILFLRPEIRPGG